MILKLHLDFSLVLNVKMKQTEGHQLLKIQQILFLKQKLHQINELTAFSWFHVHSITKLAFISVIDLIILIMFH